MKPVFDNFSHFAAPVPLPWFEGDNERRPDRPFPAVQVLNSQYDGCFNWVTLQPLDYASPQAGMVGGLLPVGLPFRMLERDYRRRVMGALTHNLNTVEP